MTMPKLLGCITVILSIAGLMAVLLLLSCGGRLYRVLIEGEPIMGDTMVTVTYVNQTDEPLFFRAEEPLPAHGGAPSVVAAHSRYENKWLNPGGNFHVVVERRDFSVVFDESYTWKQFAALGDTVTVTSLQPKPTQTALPTSTNQAGASPTVTSPGTPTPWRVIAGDRTAPGVFNEVTAVALDGQGNMYIGDKWNSRIQRLSPDGAPLAQWGTRGSGPGQFLNIVSIALDRQGNVYVLDARLTTDSRSVNGKGNNRIQKLSPEGKPLAQWGSEGRKPGQFFLPTSIVVDSQGYTYVADTGNNRIQKISPEGKPVAQWAAVAEGGLHPPVGIGVDGQDNILVPNSLGQILKFSPDGDLVAQLTESDEQQWSSVVRMAVAVDSEGNIFTLKVADNAGDGNNDHIRKLSPSGQLLGQWGSTGGFPGQFHFAHDLALDTYGNMYVANTEDDSVAKLSGSGQPVAQFGAPPRVAAGYFDHPDGIALDDQGNIFVADWGNQRVQKLSSVGQPIDVWGGLGQGVGDIGRPKGIAVDHQGNVYMTDGFSRIQKLSSTGQVLWTLGSRKTVPEWGELSSPQGIACDDDGNVYVADSGNGRVQMMSPDGQTLAQWGTRGSGAEQLKDMNGIAVDKQGNIYVADAGNRRVQKLTAEGRSVPGPGLSGLLRRFTNWAGSRVQFEYPRGIAVDPHGNIFVADGGNDRVVKLSSDGKLLAQWDGTGIGPGQFQTPAGVAVDAQGNVFVMEWTNKRIQKLPADSQ